MVTFARDDWTIHSRNADPIRHVSQNNTIADEFNAVLNKI